MSEFTNWAANSSDRRAREAARDAARERGLTLSEYLAEILMKDDAPPPPREEAAPQPFERDRAPTPALASQSLDHLTRRIEAVEARSTLAITGIDQSVLGLLTRLEKSEASQADIAHQLDSLLDNIRSAQESFETRIKSVETDDSGQRSLESLAALEDALSKLATHVYDESGMVADETTAIKARIESGLSDVSERVEGVEVKLETTLTEAARKVDQAVEQIELRSDGVARHLSDRVSALENSLAGRFAKADQSAKRIDAVSSDVGGAIESMEQTLLRMQERLNRAENATDVALQNLDASFESLESRVESVAAQASPEGAGAVIESFESRFEALASEIRATVETTRQELIGEIARATETLAVAEDTGNIEARLDDLQAKLEATNKEAFEARFDDLSARLETSEAMHERVVASEQASAEAIEQIGHQVAIVAQRVSARQDEFGQALSDRLEEVAQRQDTRLSEALSSVSERLDDIQQQSAQSLSPMQRAIASLATRLESLEDATSPAEAAARLAERFDEPAPLMMEAPKPAPAPAPMPEPAAAASEPFEPPAPSFEEPAASAPLDDDFEAGIESWMDEITNGVEAAQPPSQEPPSPQPAQPAAAEAPMPEAQESDVFEDDFDGLLDPIFEETEITRPEPAPAFAAAPEPLTAPDLDDPLEALADWDDGSDETRDSDIFDEFPEAPEAAAAPEPEAPETERPAEDYLMRARRAAMEAASQPVETTKRGKTKKAKPEKKKKETAEKPESSGSSRVPIYAAAGVIAVTAAGAGGYLYLRGKSSNAVIATPTAAPAEITSSVVETPEPAAAVPAAETVADATFAPATIADEVDALEGSASVNMITAAPPDEAAVAPELVPPLPSIEEAAKGGNALAAYMLGVQQLEAEEYASAARNVQAAAESGITAAQYRLAKLHERGLGVPRDFAAARDWTEKAAEGGNINAMHDLAVYFAEGEGGAQSYAGAVEWFRQAAEYGVVDSQYNLGVLYEQGLGITADPVEALTWFRIASTAGDAGAPAKAADLTDALTKEQAEEARTRAASWKAQPADPIANGALPDDAWRRASASHVYTVQAALSYLGYGAGEPDGDMGPATATAIRAFQRDAGLTATGTIDEALIEAVNARLSS